MLLYYFSTSLNTTKICKIQYIQEWKNINRWQTIKLRFFFIVCYCILRSFVLYVFLQMGYMISVLKFSVSYEFSNNQKIEVKILIWFLISNHHASLTARNLKSFKRRALALASYIFDVFEFVNILNIGKILFQKKTYSRLSLSRTRKGPENLYEIDKVRDKERKIA